MFSTDPDATEREKQCIRLAERNLRRLNTRIERNAITYIGALQSRLAYATSRLGENPQEARGILAGIIRLYGDKPWANEVVEQARELLSSAEHETPTIP